MGGLSDVCVPPRVFLHVCSNACLHVCSRCERATSGEKQAMSEPDKRRLRNEQEKLATERSEHAGLVTWRWASLFTRTPPYKFWARGACHRCVCVCVAHPLPSPAENAPTTSSGSPAACGPNGSSSSPACCPSLSAVTCSPRPPPPSSFPPL